MNLNVLKFYQKTPFNQYRFTKKESESIKYTNPRNFIPILIDIDYNNEILEIGSGSGWLINGLAYHENAFGIGLDFNKKAVLMSNKVSNKLNLNTNFIKVDMFEFAKEPIKKFKTIISFGVLHHTRDCHEAIKTIVENLLEKDGVFIIGLYHSYERKPFLDYFNYLKESGLSKKELFSKYKKLKHKNFINKNKKLIRSVFNDQVLHPYETQHSFIEIKNLLEELNCTVVKTSINNYKEITNNEDWELIEKNILSNAQNDISNHIFNPGLFTVMAIKN
jgi:hypothetical protein